MNVKLLLKPSLRRLFVFFAILVFFLALLSLGMYFVSEQVNQHREQIVSKVKEELGLPITFDNIKTSWVGLSLRISLQNVTVYDPAEPVAFMAINKIKLYPDLSSILFESQPRFKKLVLQGLKLVIGWEKKGGLSILGLKGESIPTTIQFSTLMTLLSTQKSIVIEGSEIDWRGPNVQIKQWWNGKFNWVKSQEVDWVLKGEQQFQIREGLNLPPSDFTLSVSPDRSAINLELSRGGFISQCNFTLKKDEPSQVACEGNIKNLDIERIFQIYQPQPTDYPLLKWLGESLPNGRISQASIKVSGPLDTLQSEGKIAFEDINFQYAPGWPAIEEAGGLIHLENDKVTVQLSSGKIMGSPIGTASALIEPIANPKNPIIQVQGTIKSTLKNGLLFLQNSPLQQNLATYLESLDPSGSMDLNLQLTIPLEEKVPIKVEGGILVKEGQIKVPGTHILLSQLGGEFHFTENGIESSEIKAYLGEKLLDINVKTITNAKLQTFEIAAKGLFSAGFLQQEFHLPILEKLYGESLFTITLKKSFINKKSPGEVEWSITSDLEGMAIQLPDFLGKTTDQRRPITLTVGLDIENDRKIAIHIENLLDAKILLQEEEGEYKLKNGHIVFGKGSADWISKEALLIGGEIGSFKLVDWKEFFNTLNLNDQNLFPKLNIHLLVDRLEVYGLRFDKIWVTSDYEPTGPTWSIDGPFIKGTVSLPTPNNQVMNINLEYLKVMTDNISKKTTTDFLLKQTKFPLMFHCKNFQYEKGNFGEVSFKLSPSSYGYAIEDLSFETRVSELSGSGEWHLEKDRSYTILKGKLVGLNMGKTFSEWGYPSAVRESSGYIKYQFKWPKDPFQFDMSIVEGTAELKFDKGRIIGVDPGLGRILGLLNVENIRRRLQLDFSDLLKKGFVFDTVRGKFSFQNGMANTKELLIDGPSAKIELTGNANLKDKTIVLNMTVISRMSVGIPIAAAIAAGPAVGAGVWIIDKLTGSKINKIIQHKYRVTGTWDAPIIQDRGEAARKEN